MGGVCGTQTREEKGVRVFVLNRKIRRNKRPGQSTDGWKENIDMELSVKGGIYLPYHNDI